MTPKSKTTAIFPLAVIGVVAMMVVPLPSLILDLLLAVNISVGVLVLLSALNSKKVLDLASFPSILLLATLFRLGLNVSTTRQILGSGSAGSVITSFGQSVVGGSLVVGLVVFFILVTIQFVVITNGSSRVSEVAARFTLDAMPGKQMAIDADLNAGLISDSEARRRRVEIAREADFFGAMDGASKFVKGDAIAGIIITVVNLLGGLAIGMTSMGLSASDAINRFAMLTIGDGLVSQIPALLISIAAGIVVTRSSSAEEDLGSAVSGEFSKQQRSFQLAGVSLAALGALPGLPFIPFAGVGSLLILVSIRLRPSESLAEAAEEVADAPAENPDDPEVLMRRMRVEPLELEIAHDMTDLVDEARGGDLLDRIRGLRRKVALESGFVMPPLRTRDNAGLQFGQYRILVHGVEVAVAEAPPGRVLVIDENLSRWPGEEITEPVFGLPAKWVPESFRETIEGAGGTVVDRSALITTHLGEIVARHAADLFDREQLKALVDSLAETHPAVLEDIGSSNIPMPTLQWVIRELLSAGVPIRDTSRILEASAASYGRSADPEEVVEDVRRALGPAICAASTDNGVLHVITLDGMLEHELLAALATTNGSDALDAQTLQEVVSDIVAKAQSAQNTGIMPVLVCSPQLRRSLATILDQIDAAPPVLSFKEVGVSVKLATVGTVAIPVRSLGSQS